MQNYTAHITAKLTPDQREGVIRRAAEMGLKPGEYIRRVLVESLCISQEHKLILAEVRVSNYFIRNLIVAWLREQPISEEFLNALHLDSESKKFEMAEAVVSAKEGK